MPFRTNYNFSVSYITLSLFGLLYLEFPKIYFIGIDSIQTEYYNTDKFATYIIEMLLKTTKSRKQRLPLFSD